MAAAPTTGVKVDTPVLATATTTTEVTAATAATATAPAVVAAAAAAAEQEIDPRQRHQTYVIIMNSTAKKPDLAEKAV